MCVVSMISDHYDDLWKNMSYTVVPVTREEFDELKKEVENFKQLLIKAKIYDEKNNEPNCEMAEKMERIRKIAELVGVDLNDIIKK